jgi:hypothetical protein
VTRTTNARTAGVTIFLYIAAGLTSLAMSGRAHATDVLALCTSFTALILGVTLYAITREQDPDLALLALVCRVIEGMPRVEGAVHFAIGSALFSWLLLRGRMIPVALSSVGVVASVALAAVLLVQRAGLFGGPTNWASRITWMIWLPMLVFEIALGVWLVVKGVAAPARAQAV